MGYNTFADDVAESNNGRKGGSYICDSGCPFDGLYVGHGTAKYGSTWWIPSDSCHGVIEYDYYCPDGVEEETAATFRVEQNTPNPFNPTTTMSYTLADAVDVTVDVTVDVYNVAGQKIDTLVNEFQTKGTQSVVWNASGFSAGVYFYTVKINDFSRTMKMTLLK